MDQREMTRLIHRAYIRDGDTLHYGEPVLLACMLHAKGRDRNSEDMKQVQKIMKDINLDKRPRKKSSK